MNPFMYSPQESADAQYRLAHMYFGRAQQARSAAVRDYWLGAANAQQQLAARTDEKIRIQSLNHPEHTHHV